ncbi:unnamed protein product [Larinioides sclopetarius]|uniref:Uncharacterized protein n=1 Tax=Larinioides sclopetarius TaxID=280406 RepID=A0AAV1ZZV9_9ARAC
METVSDVCPTGILIDIGLQSKGLSNINKESDKIQASVKNKRENVIAADTNSPHPWTSNCFLDQSPPKPSPIMQMKLETPVVASSVRRIHSFHTGGSKNAFPVERKFMSTTESCSKVLKPKMSLNQVSINGNRLSTPLQSGRFKPANSSTANPMQRKSLVFGSNYSLVASNIKVAAQNDRHSTIKKPVVNSSSRHGLVKKLSMPSSLPKFKNDSLSRKLFP